MWTAEEIQCFDLECCGSGKVIFRKYVCNSAGCVGCCYTHAMEPYISVPVVAFGREFKLQINSHIENHRRTRARVQVFSLEFLSINL